MTIGETAKAAGVRPSAIRYYEKLGLLPAPRRVGGRRRYGAEALDRLAVIRFGRETGFTIAELRKLVRGFPDGTPAPARWSDLARRKIADMDLLIARARGVKSMLERILGCECGTLEECGRKLNSLSGASDRSPPAGRRPS